jgi:hypothetical protein
MASLTDLFNPQFLMFLGILVLCLALLVVYFESKLRDQNHKISSMLSVVSSLADEVNLLRNSFIGGSINRMEFNPVLVEKASDLINVSDDEEELEEDDDDDDDDDDLEEELDEDEEEDDDDDSEEEVKVFKISDSNDLENDVEELGDDLEDDDLEGDDLEGHNLEVGELGEVEEQTKSIQIQLNNDISNLTDLKSVNITLEENEPESESLDYKKLSINKLKSIVLEKKLVTDASKLKKPELLKLLGIE